MRSAKFVIEGSAISDIPSFYDEINRVFMAAEDWQLGHSLDALNDVLYGGFGAIQGGEEVTVVWRDIELSREALGLDATRAFYRAKLERPETFNVARISNDLDALECGAGATFFEIVLEIFADHPNITLVRA